MKQIGSYIQYLKGECEIAKIIGYEIRENATYIIVKGVAFEFKINILNEGKIFKYLE